MLACETCGSAKVSICFSALNCVLDVGDVSDRFEADVPSHGVVMLRVSSR